MWASSCVKARTRKRPCSTPESSWLPGLLFTMLPVALLIGFFVFMNRRAQSQMGGVMSIGRSKAKTYSTERPGTTFADVAGYDGVKQEIREVVDFLKYPERFGEIGARIPKGILLVGPPGTGKSRTSLDYARTKHPKAECLTLDADTTRGSTAPPGASRWTNAAITA